MAFTKNYRNELFWTVLVLSALLSTTSAIDCYGKSFHCVNSTHFMICVDLGGGVSQAIEDFTIACPPPTVCQGNNHFECEFPAPTTPDTTLNNAIEETTIPWEEIVTVSSLNNTTKEFSENYMDTTIENGTTAAVEYSVTTDTTVDVTLNTESTVYINNELNVTEIVAETTTTPEEILPQTLNEVTVVTQTTEIVPTTGVEIVAQPTAETPNYIQTETVVPGEESITSAINNTQTTTENKVITETVTERTEPVTTEQMIQTTPNDHLEQTPAYIYTDLPQVITLFQNERIINNTLLNDSSVANKNIQVTEKPKLSTLDNATKNKDLFSISGITDVIQPSVISQNVEITSTVESIVEITTASNNHFISIPSDNIPTDVYHIDNGLHKDTAAPTELEETIESKLTSDKEKNKESKISIVNNVVDEIKPTVGQWDLALNNEKLSTTPYTDVFTELTVTTDLPFVNDGIAKADNQSVVISTNAQNNEVTTTLDGIFATETLRNDSSSTQTTSIVEGTLIKESTQNVATVDLDIVTTEAVYTTISNSNVQSVTTQDPLFMATSQNSVDGELGGAFSIGNIENTASTELPTTINQQNLTISTTQNIVTENNLILTSEAIYQGIATTDAINKPTKFVNTQTTMTEIPSLVTNTQNYEDMKLDSAYKVTKETMATDTPAITTAQPTVTKGPHTQSDRPSTHNLVDTELDGRYISENVKNTASTKQPTTVYESLTVETKENAVYQGIVSIEAMYEPTTVINLHETMTAAPSLITKTQNVDSSSIVEFGASTEQTKLINEEIRTNTPDMINAKPIITEDSSLGTMTQNSAGMKLVGAFINKTSENIASMKHPNTINEQSLDITQNVVVENIIIPTSEAANRGNMSPEAIYESNTIINLQTMITEPPSNVTKTQITVNMKQDTTLITKSVESFANTDQLETTDTSANIATEKITIPTMQAVHTIISTTKPPPTELYTTTEALLLTTVPNPITKEDVTQIEDNDSIAEIAITTNKESSTTNTEQNVAPHIVINPTSKAVNLHSTKRESLYTLTSISNDNINPVVAENMSNKAQLITTQIPPSGTVTERALNSEIIDNSASTIQQAMINEESVTADTADWTDVASIISKTQIVKENETATEGVNISKVPLSSLEYTESTRETGSTNVVTAKSAVLSFEQKKLQLSENNLISGADLETVAESTSDTYNLPATNAIELNFNMEPTMASIHGDTIIIDKESNDTNNIVLSEFAVPKKGSYDISKQAFLSQQSKKKAILITNDAQNSTVQPSNIERNNHADNINLNPLKNDLIDKSNLNPEPARKSSVTNLNIEQNGIDAVTPDTAFVSQQPFKSSLPASSSISDEPYNHEQSTTETQAFIQISTNELLKNITKADSEHVINTLPVPESKIKEDSNNRETSTLSSGGLLVVSSPTTVQTRVAVDDTTMLDSIHNAYETIAAFLRPGSKPTVKETDNNPGESGSIANVSSAKTESQNPKHSQDSIPPSQTAIYEYKLTTNDQDVSETSSTEKSTKREASSKPIVLEDLPLPIENVELRSTVTNIPVVRDLTAQSQNENIVQITESYKSVTFNPAPANTETHVNVNGAHITTAPTPRKPTLNMQAGFTDKANVKPKNSVLGDSVIVVNLQIRVSDNNSNIKTDSSLGDAASNSPTDGIDRADISSQHLQQVEQGPIEITRATDYAHIQPHTEQRENKTIENVFRPISSDNTQIRVPPQVVQATKNQIHKSNSNALEDFIVNTVDQKTNPIVITDLKYASQNGSHTEREPQQNNSPTNYTLSTHTQKTYANSTAGAPSQSATQKPISHTNNITKPVTNDAITFNCINGIRGRYSDKDDCRKFYICVGNNQPIVGNCPENTVFSDVKKLCTKNLSHCIRQNEFKCPSAGRFSDFMKDNVYYICVNHMNHLYKFKFQCQKGYILNKTIVKCIETKEIESNESVSISTSDSSSQTGSASTISSNANSDSISSGTLSNSNGGDSSSKSEDSSKTKKNKEAEETPDETQGNENKVKKDDEDEVFKCKKEGKFPIRNECRRYYLCKKKGSQYRRKVKKCDSGRVFHKDKKKCVDADDYDC